MDKAILVAGLAHGDEGKGAAVDYLVRKYNATAVVRYNGGHQAAHNVVLPDGRHHTFSQFSAGTFVPNVKTYLSRFMMINPIAMETEEKILQSVGIEDAFDRVCAEQSALIVTPFDKELNIIKEQLRGDKAHGSCGVGIGEAKRYSILYGDEAITVGDLRYEDKCRLKLKIKQLRFSDTIKQLKAEGLVSPYIETSLIIDSLVDRYREWFYNIDPWNQFSFKKDDTVIFEGAQGVLLDERKEFAPHNTWSKTTFDNAYEIINERTDQHPEIVRIGCVRSYMTRHGVGPFIEDKNLDVLPEPHNSDVCFQGKFRRGHFNKAEITKALDVCGGVDEIHMSHVDYLPDIYPHMTSTDIEVYIRNLERFLETPITVTGYGPTHLDRRERGKTFTARRRSAEVRAGLSCSTT